MDIIIITPNKLCLINENSHKPTHNPIINE